MELKRYLKHRLKSYAMHTLHDLQVFVIVISFCDRTENAPAYDLYHTKMQRGDMSLSPEYVRCARRFVSFPYRLRYCAAVSVMWSDGASPLRRGLKCCGRSEGKPIVVLMLL